MPMSEKKKPGIPSAAKEDRISQLPDEIIHRILNRINSATEAARTSILSRRWLHLWRSYPVIEFRRQDFNSHQQVKDRFQSFATAASRRLLNHNNGETVPSIIILDAFRISIDIPRQVEEQLQNLLASASLLHDGSRSPLEILVHTINLADYVIPFPDPYSFPDGTFLNCRRTRSLDLSGCDLSHYGPNCNIFLNSLQCLRLSNCRISQEILQSCLANAPNLDELSFTWLEGFDSLDLSHPNLKTLSIGGRRRSYLNLTKLQLHLISAPLLHTLRFPTTQNSKLNVAPSLTVPNLKLLEITDDSCKGFDWHCELEDLISKSPSLESLDIHRGAFCTRAYRWPLPRLRIKNDNLRKLTLAYSNSEKPLEIDAPNLVRLYITTNSPVNIGVANVANNCKCVVEWHIDSKESLTKDWFVELRRHLEVLIRSFHHQLVLKLHFLDYYGHQPKVPLCPGEVECTSSPLTEIQHVEFGKNFWYSMMRWTAKKNAIFLLEGLLSIGHPKRITQVEYSKPLDSHPSMSEFGLAPKLILDPLYMYNSSHVQGRSQDLEIGGPKFF